MNWRADFLENFEIRLRELLIANIEDELFRQAVLYQFFPAGKRIRPLLLAGFFYDLFDLEKTNKDTDREILIDFAIALEILHTASLIHDDLPGLDNDSERRGRPTLHIQVGEGRAILAGDYLIARAFSICGEATSKLQTKSHALSTILANAFCDVCFGQDLDIRNTSEDSEKALKLYDLKTGSLFFAALEAARVLYFDATEVFEHNKSFARALGRSFQVLNDFRDKEVNQNHERSANSDEKNKRATALTLVSEQQSRNFVHSIYNETWESLNYLEEQISVVLKTEKLVLTKLRDVLSNVIMLPK